MKAKRLQWDNSTDAATAEGVLGTYAIYEPGHWGSQWLQDNSAKVALFNKDKWLTQFEPRGRDGISKPMEAFTTSIELARSAADRHNAAMCRQVKKRFFE